MNAGKPRVCRTPAKRLVYATTNGQVLRCTCCRQMDVIFGNLVITFRPDAFTTFVDFINGLDVAQMEATNHALPHPRKVLIQVPPTNVKMAFHAGEIAELRRLLHGARNIVRATSLTNAGTSEAHRLN